MPADANVNLFMLGALAALLGEPAIERLVDAAVEVLGAKNDPADCEPRSKPAIAAKDHDAQPERLARARARRRRRPRRGRAAADGRLAHRLKPVADLSLCVDCLLCWLYCPDSAVLLDGATFAGIDLDYCKGCELCAAVCPTSAIEMVRDGD